MKKILLFAAFAALTATAQAQTDKREMRKDMPPQERAEMQARHMQKKLNLTDDQTKQVMEVNLQNMPEENLKNEPADMPAKRKELMNKREAAYSKILTQEQMDSYRKMKEERMEKMKERREK